jgi:multiple sugar transport system substrate-binding protein
MNVTRRPAVFVACVLILLLAACQVPGAAPPGAAAPGESGERVELLYMTHNFAPAADLNNELIAEFTEMHPNVTIEYDHAPHDSYEQKVLTAYAGGQGPDIFWAGDWMMPQFLAQNIVAPVNYSVYGVNSAGEYEELFAPNSLTPFTHEGEIYTGGLSEYNTFSLLINIDHFEEAGLPLPSTEEPITWEEFATIAEALAQQDAGGNVTRNALVWPFTTGIWTVLILEPLVHQLGGQLVDPETGRPDFLSEEMVKTMQYVQDLRFTHNALDPAIYTGLLDDFGNGATSTIIAGPWAISNLARINPDLNYMVVPLPMWADGERVTTLYAWAWFVNPNSDPVKQEWAWRFAEHLSANAQRWWDEVRYVQARLVETSTGEAISDYQVSTEPMMPVFLEDYNYGRFQFRSPHYFELSDIWTRATTRILEGEDVMTVLTDAQAAADAAVD